MRHRIDLMFCDGIRFLFFRFISSLYLPLSFFFCSDFEEYVNLIREPQNLYDRNAIRVDNLQHIKVGHIKKQQAAILAPFMDRKQQKL